MVAIKNSYFRAILKVTGNGKYPELADCWRSYHPFSYIFDSDYSSFTDSCFFSPSHALLYSSDSEILDSDSGRILTTRHEEEKPARVSPKKLYVPVTRKVSPPAWKNPSFLTCKVTDTDDSKTHFFTCKVSLTGETNPQKLH